jgi:hypothetical protein
MTRFTFRMNPACVATAVAIQLLSAAPLGAQSLRGRVVDATTGAPVVQATVAVLLDDRTIAGSLTDATGSFTIRLREEGSFVIRATGQGYATLDMADVQVADRENLALGDLRLDLAPIVLEELILETSAGRARGQEKVRRRQLLGKGSFFSGAELVELRPRSLTEYLAQQADLEVRVDNWGFPYLWSPVGPHHCLVVQVNHWPLSTQGYRSLDEIRLSRVAAIEIYNTVADVPPEADLIRYTEEPRLFPEAKCGLVNVWLWLAW